MAKDAFFWNLIAKRYAAQPVADQKTYERKLEITKALLCPEDDVFEFGCGTGSTALTLAAHARHIHATDLSHKMIAIAQEKADAANIKNITFEVAAIDDVMLSEGQYDMVLGHSILHLLPNYSDVVARAARALKPGGLFITSTMCLGKGYGILKGLVVLLSPVGLLPKVQFFTKEALSASFESAGFTIEEQWSAKPGGSVFTVARKTH